MSSIHHNAHEFQEKARHTKDEHNAKHVMGKKEQHGEIRAERHPGED
jgi:hypothetical protein